MQWAVLDLLVHLPVSKFIPSRMVAPMSQYLTELLESEANGVGVQCNQLLLCTQVSSAAQTVSAIQSGVNIVVYQATCPYLPPDPDMGWQMFLKSFLLKQGFVMHLGHKGQSCPVQRNPLYECVNGWSR